MKLSNTNFTRQITSQFEQGENKELVFSICSEQPYLREDENFGPYWQVLEVTPEAINDERLKNGISFLKDHESKSQLGIVKRWWIQDRKLYVSVKFSRSNFAKAIKEDIEEGVRPWCSLGYYVERFVKTGEIDGIPVLTAKRYSIYQCSSVSVPADSTVGFNRELEIQQKGAEMEDAKNTETDSATKLAEQAVEEEKNLSREDQDTIVEDLETKSEETAEVEEKTKEVCPECGKEPCECEKSTEETDKEEKACGGSMKPEEKALEVTKEALAEAIHKEAEAIAKEIRSLGELVDAREAAEKFVAEHKSLDQFKEYLKTKNLKRGNNSIQKGSNMNKYFSISKAIRNACSQYKKDVSEEYETQVIAQNKRAFNVNDADIVLSNRELFQLRALTGSAIVGPQIGPEGGKNGESTLDGTVGQSLIATNYLPQEFVSYLRPQLTLEKTGYYSIPVNGNSISFAVCTSGSVAGMYNLDGELSGSDLKFATKTLTPHKAGVLVPVNYSMILQARPEIDAMVEADIVNALYQIRDEQILVGTGSDGQCSGILSNTEINTVVSGATFVPSISGGNAWAAILKGINEIRKANIFSENLSFVMNGDTYVELQKTMKNQNNCFAGFIIDENDRIKNYPVFVNNKMPENTILVGDFGEVAVADFEGLKIKVDDITYIKQQAIQIVAIKCFDTVCRRPKAFTKIVLEP